MNFKRKGDKVKYNFVDELCIGRRCWAAGMYQHRSPMAGGGSMNTSSPDTPCCLNRAYRGCPDGPMGERTEDRDGEIVHIVGLPEYQKDLAVKRRNEGWKRA
jgi:hypothetical protein